MSKKILSLILFTPLLCLVVWCLFLNYQRENGMNLTLPIMGYDPRDLLSGHYIQYQIDWQKVDCGIFPQGVCPEQDFCVKAEWGRECRFYIPETEAKALNRLFWNRYADHLLFEIVYSYQPGHTAIAKQLLINGLDWKQYMKKSPSL